MQRVTKELSARMSNMGFVCACLVVLIHCTPAPAVGGLAWWWCHLLGREGVCVIAVPYFFLAAGFFLTGKVEAPGWWRGETLKRVKTLLVPFIIWLLVYQVFGLAIWYLKSHVFHKAVETNPWLVDPLAQIFVLTGLHPFTDIGVFWFVRCLFGLIVISPVIVWLLRRSKVVALGCLAIAYLIVSWQFGQSGWNFYSLFDRFVTVRGALYFSLGMALRMAACSWRLSPKRLGMVAVLGVALLAAKNVASLYALHSLSNVLEALAVPLLMLAVFVCLPTKPWPVVLIGNAFAIFLAHNIFLSLAAMGFMVLHVHDNPAWQMPMMYIRFVVAVGASIALATLLRRFFSRFAALLLGGR